MLLVSLSAFRASSLASQYFGFSINFRSLYFILGGVYAIAFENPKFLRSQILACVHFTTRAHHAVAGHPEHYIVRCGRSRDIPVSGTTELTLQSKDCARASPARQQSSHGVGDSYVLYVSKCRAELEVEMERRRRRRQSSREQCREMRTTLFRERMRRISEREMPQTRSAVSRMVCIQDLFLRLRKGKGDRVVLRSDGALRLGVLLLPERRARLAVLTLSVGAAVAKM